MGSEMLWRLRRIWCLLTNGHTFADGNIESTHYESLRVTVFRNQCLKCGKHMYYAVNDEALYFGSPLADRKVKVDLDGK